MTLEQMDAVARKRNEMLEQVDKVRKNGGMADPDVSNRFQRGLEGLRFRKESLEKRIKEVDKEITAARHPGGKPVMFVNTEKEGGLRRFGITAFSAEAAPGHEQALAQGSKSPQGALAHATKSSKASLLIKKPLLGTRLLAD
ncbi:hypothetical protein T484DRAFT_2082004 [Baffinella frigidus]|nr:hypothetical protein T484DRAFT_2082004 [Cryptophyta sp. CCMP2293]